MSEVIRALDAPAEVRGVDSALIRKKKEELLAFLKVQLAPRGGARREATLDVAVDPAPDSPDAILHHVFELIRQEHPEYTLRYGGVSSGGMTTVSILRTADAAMKGLAKDIDPMFGAGYLVRGGE